MLLAVAFAACAAGQYSLSALNDGGKAATGYGLGLTVFALALATKPAAHTSQGLALPRLMPARWVLIGTAALLELAALLTLNNPPLLLQSAGFWLLGLIVALAAAVPTAFSSRRWLAAGRQLSLPALRPELVAFGAIALLGAALRFFRLDAYPNGMHPDEVTFGLAAMDILKGRLLSPFDAFYQSNRALFLYLELPFAAAFGRNIGGLRLLSALASFATLPLFYFLIRRLFGMQPALLSLAILALNGAYIGLAHFALNDSEVPLLTCAALCALWEAYRSSRVGWWFAAGIITGFAMYFAYSALLLPLVFGSFLAYLLITQRTRWRTWAGGAAGLFLGGITALAPIPLRPGQIATLMNRADDRFIFTKWQQVTQEQHTASVIGVLVGQLRTNVLVFFSGSGGGINDALYFMHSPMLAVLLGPLFVLGLALAFWRIRDPRYALLLCWFWVMVIVGGALAVESPMSYRLIVPLLPAIAFVALSIEWIAATAARLADYPVRGPILAGAGVLIAVAGFHDTANYFHAAVSERPWEEVTLQGRYVASLGPSYRPYVMGTPAIYYTRWAQFLAPDTPDASLHNPANLPLAVPADHNLAFLVYGAMRDSLPLLQSMYPDGQSQDEYVKSGVDFTAYTVPSSQVVAHQGLTASYASGARLEANSSGLGGGADSYPAATTWTGSVYTAQAGRYVFRADGPPAQMALDGSPLTANSPRDLWIGWHTLQLQAALPDPDARLSLQWQTPISGMGPIAPQWLYNQALPNTLRGTLRTQDGAVSQRWDR
ncbi:MAG TPA: glycosyltransferase family 39 protein, partial [Chloroflexota bacterium]|nr:glycosyltransferase family 39 protein [Chloroflexota bacterium]